MMIAIKIKVLQLEIGTFSCEIKMFIKIQQ